MFKIGEFSKLSNTTIRALHYYEEKGLLIPHVINPETNYRYYSAEQLRTINKIKLLQEMGMSLDTISEILSVQDLSVLDYHYQLRQQELATELDSTKQKLSLLEKLQSTLTSGKKLENYNVTLKEFPKCKVMSLRKSIPTYDDESLLWQQLYQQSLDQKVKLTTPPAGMTIYHDLEFKEQDYDVEVQSNVVGDHTNQNEVTYFERDSFTAATVTFNGSFDQMADVTEAIALWLETHHCLTNGVMFNIPIVSPAHDPNPENWVTESGFIITNIAK